MSSGCSGGGDDDDDGPQGGFTVNVTIPPLTDAAQQPYVDSLGIVCANFTVSGPANQVFNLIAEYLEVGVGLPVPASQPLTEQTMAGGGPVPNFVLQPLDGSGNFSGTIYWAAGRDLGFLPADVQFCLTASAGTLTGTGCSLTFTFPGGTPSQGSSGSGAGSGSQGNPDPAAVGRAGQSAHNVRGTLSPGAAKNVLLAGGYNGAMVPNAFQGVDRFDVTGGSSYQIAFPSSPVGQQRVLHASSFFLDPTTSIIKVLVTGGVNAYTPPALNPTGLPNLATLVNGAMDTSSTSVYCFSPTEQLQAAAMMSTPRWGHTATWCQDNKVVVVGGASGTVTPMVLNSIEIYDPETGTWSTSAAQLGTGVSGCPTYTGRVFHTAVQLANGNVLIFGGFDPNNPTLELPAEIYDARNDTITAICPPMRTGFTRIGHTCTRLANGWVLIAGGRNLNGNLMSSALVYKPEPGVPGSGGFTVITMPQAIAHHAATLQGNGQVMLSGGINGASGSEGFTNAVVAYDPTVGDYGVFSAAEGSFMMDDRADHTATAVDCGSVWIIGGRNGTSPTFTYLDSVEYYAFSNDVPVVTNPMTQTSTGGPGTLALAFTVTDSNQDGGYVYVRFRETGSTEWKKATITSQMPSSAPSNYPNLEVEPGNYTLVWNAAADEFVSGETATVQIIPVGAVLGTPVSFLVSIP